MRFVAAVILVVGSVSLSAQQQQPAAGHIWERVTPDTETQTGSGSGSGGGAGAHSAAVGSSPTHQHAVEFVRLTGVRQQMLSQFDESMVTAKASVARSNPNANPAFVEEWARRMKAQFSPDDYVAVVVRVYENHFSNAELLELIRVQHDSKLGKPTTLSPALQQKMARDGVTIQSEILGGCAQVGAQEGGEVAKEIQHEHPEWASQAQPVAAGSNQ